MAIQTTVQARSTCKHTIGSLPSFFTDRPMTSPCCVSVLARSKRCTPKNWENPIARSQCYNKRTRTPHREMKSLTVGVLFRDTFARSAWISRWHLGQLLLDQLTFPQYMRLAMQTGGIVTTRRTGCPPAKGELELTSSIPTMTLNIDK